MRPTLLRPLLRTPTARTRTPSPATPSPPAAPAPPRIILSTTLSPLHNLAYEDWLFRHTPADVPLLFLYRNSACVVIGRNQNPWLETSPAHLSTQRIPLVRRRSGGGAVFHDPGNTNYSMMLPRAAFDRPAQAELVRRALARMGVGAARVNERNDIYLGGWKMSPLSTSCAYKIISHRAYHHGTMLLSTDTSILSRALYSPLAKRMSTSRSIASVRAPVIALSELGAGALDPALGGLQQQPEGGWFAHERFVRAMGGEWADWFGVPEPGERERERDGEGAVMVGEEEMESLEHVRKGMEELGSWEWTYGQTPLFEVQGLLPLPGSTTVSVFCRPGRGRLTRGRWCTIKCTMGRSSTSSSALRPARARKKRA
ncbi:hypothetical protein CALCODRAFT_425357 [Calocera cornea HHB12733]|uniref:Putative lipoate-protein ligase A n=1 Tax=Calocera cornea HHB12733 TaxID=1353952 RepID=A0A165K8U0_9BASI|nr:hypothetical protein CALCODRAFT_425357 [Calocera cornea HHB12733]